MHYRIIATLGPASSQPQIWQALLAAGASEFRLNTSHLSLAETSQWLERLAALYPQLGQTFPVTLDLQGSKWRLGEFPTCELTPGQTICLINNGYTQDAGFLPVPHNDFFQAATQSNPIILLNDAKIELECRSVGSTTLTTRVVRGGWISSRKAITFPDSTYRVERLSEKDQSLLAHTQNLDFVRYAISYVKDARELASYRAAVPPQAYLAAKLERPSALADAEAIVGSPVAPPRQVASSPPLANEAWLCRGDLGAELGLAQMAQAVSKFTHWVRESPAPILLAGQVLEHMTTSSTPTRSEICYLYDALQHGYHGVVLSDETAIGQHPVEAVWAAALFRDHL